MKKLLLLTALAMLTVSMGCCGQGLFGHRLFHRDCCPCESAGSCETCCAAGGASAGEEIIIPPGGSMPTPIR